MTSWLYHPNKNLLVKYTDDITIRSNFAEVFGRGAEYSTLVYSESNDPEPQKDVGNGG